MGKFKKQLDESLLFLRLRNEEKKGFIEIGKLNPNEKTGNPQHPGHVGRVIHFGQLMNESEVAKEIFLSGVITQKWVFELQRLHKDFGVQTKIMEDLVEQMKRKGREKITEKEFLELGLKEE
jgi:hypothetical protein